MLTNEKIEENMAEVAKLLPAAKGGRSAEETKMTEIGLQLLTNFLVNVNTIARSHETVAEIQQNLVRGNAHAG